MMLFKNLVMQCDVILMIFAYQTKFNISGRKRATSFLPKRLYDHFDLCNEMKRRLGEISCHKHSNLMLLAFPFESWSYTVPWLYQLYNENKRLRNNRNYLAGYKHEILGEYCLSLLITQCVVFLR